MQASSAVFLNVGPRIHAMFPILGSGIAGNGHLQPVGQFSVSPFFVGIAVAIIAFIVKEQVKHSVAGFRFRKRICKDIGLMVKNYSEHLPSLCSLQAGLEKDIQALASDSSLIPELHPIWSAEFSMLRDIYENSAHLNPDAFSEVVDFYDVEDRIDPVRNTYNSVVQQCEVSGIFNRTALEFLNTCLKFMMREYKKLIPAGCDALMLMSKKHRFSSPNTAKCVEIKRMSVQA